MKRIKLFTTNADHDKHFYPFRRPPAKRLIANKARAMKKMIFAKTAKLAAIPPNPKIPAISATMANAIDILNITVSFKVV